MRSAGDGAVDGAIHEMRVGLGWGLRPESLRIEGGRIEIRGSPSTLRERLAPSHPDATGGSSSGGLKLEGNDLSLSWRDEAGSSKSAEAEGLAFSKDGSSFTLSAAHASITAGTLRLEGTGMSVDVLDGELRRAHAGEATVGVVVGDAVPGTPSPIESPPPSPSIRAIVPAAQPVAASSKPGGPSGKPAAPGAKVLPAAPAPPDEGIASFQLPDTHHLREQVASLAAAVATRWPAGAELGVDGMRWEISPGDPRKALTVGPGPLTIRHDGPRIEVEYSADRRGERTSVTAHAALPLDDGDATATLEGGPVALSLLGVHDGALGLVDVDRATVAGRVAVRLAGDGSALTFDVDATARSVALDQPRLASETIRGLDVQLVARGALADGSALRLDDLAATIGALHVAGSGALERRPDRLLASFRFDLPSTPCQSLLESLPTALLPALQGATWAGSFGARGRFAFDTTALDDLELDYDVQDACRASTVPAELARARFKQPFQERITLPDGSTTLQAAGPGSPNWTALADISPFMEVAVMTTEDGAFFHHHGFNHAAIKASIIANLKAGRFVRGASTVSMQLAKNLFLTREKTLSRKLEEVVLTDYLEQIFSKEEILELYLNAVEFGPAVYGITAASEYYFGRTPAELDVAECFFLSSILPAPRRYGGMRDQEQVPEGWMRNLRGLMKIAGKRGLLRDTEVEEGLAQVVPFWHGGPMPPPRPRVPPRSMVHSGDGDAPVSVPDDTSGP